MKITRDKLLSADLDTLFTRDPSTFFEALLINILWDKEPSSVDQELVARQRVIFDRWFKYFEANLRIDIEKELGIVKAKATADYQAGHVAGRIHALTNLPLRNGALGKSVDLTKVAAELKKLKAPEPVGVTHESIPSINNF
jgi:hypothetical protein